MPGPRVSAEVAPAVWATFLAELWRWVAEHGDARVPTVAVTVIEGQRFMLGSRVKNARVYYHRGSLTAQQIAQLEALPGWSWDGYAAFSAAAWRDRIGALRAYVAEHGSVAGLHQADPSLGRWLQVQRSSPLPPARRAELDAIPPTPGSPASRLDVFLADLDHWVSAVPGRDARHLIHATTVTIDGRRVPLGARGAVWRRRFRRGELSPEQIARLDAIPGWEWKRAQGRRPRATEALSRD